MFSKSFPRVLLRSTLPPPPSSSFLKRPIQPLYSSNLIRRPVSSSSTSISSPPTSSKPQTPLFLRTPTISTSLSDLKKWETWAKNLALSIGSKFSESDNGPDAELLCRELKWLLEDAVEDGNSLISDEDGKFVKLRTSLDELYLLWKQRIEERRPLQYLVGCEHWRDLVLCVQQGVLIPRPETEMLVELVEEEILKDKRIGEGLWADLGTGSGAVAIAIGRVLGSGGRVIATDVSSVAASVAEFNVQRYDLQDKIEIRHGSWFEPLEDVKGKLVGLVSNPPYIPSEQIFGLQAEVGRHEPKLALDGGEQGMDDLLHLCEGAASMLKPGGFFAFETNGEKQSELLQDSMLSHSKCNFRDVRIVADFAGIRRFVTGYVA